MDAIKQLEAELVRLKGECDKSAANYNYLVGAYKQTEEMIKMLKGEQEQTLEIVPDEVEVVQ